MTDRSRHGTFSTLLAALASLVLLIACGGQTTTGGGEDGAGFQPTTDVVMIVPFAPGGGSDILARAMSAGLEQVGGDVTVTVENRPAGSGAAGYSYLLEQTGDPHFLLASETTGVALPIATEVPFHWSDFTPIAQIAEDATLMVVREDSPHRSLSDVIEAAGQSQVNMGVTGATSLDTIVTGLVEEDQGVEFERVVFESGGELVTALLAGDIDVATLNPGEVIGQLEAGKMRALAVFDDERYPKSAGDLADIPTAKEEGVDVTFTQYRGLLAAGQISNEERAYWEDSLLEWTKESSYDKYIKENILKPVIRPGKEFEDYLTEYEKTLEPILGGG
jgi:putative tricarboxylic transport membrane protein